MAQSGAKLRRVQDRAEDRVGRPAWLSLVTHRTGDMEPGTGFYAMARKAGFQFSDPLTFWSTQVQEIFKRYGEARS